MKQIETFVFNKKCPVCGKRSCRKFIECQEVRVIPNKPYPDCLGLVDFHMADCKSCGAYGPESWLRFITKK